MDHFRFSHRWLAVVIGAFAVAYLVAAVRIPDFPLGVVTVQPGVLPTWLGLLLLGLSVVLFFQRSAPVPAPASASPGPELAPERQSAPEHGAGSGPAGGSGAAPGARPLGRLADVRYELTLVLATMIGYVALLEPLGFALTTALYLSCMTWYFGYRRHLVNVAVSIALSAALQVGMTQGLGVALPPGPLPW